mmetsp:Transcript_12846/g.55133  ORF Transcript_12846/g.55133 Transcript_12846/m.55133 type:complete len:322 (-) Transcript_12846:135-1100(-)
MGVCASTPKADAEPEAKVSHRKNVPTPAEVADAAVLEARRARYAVLTNEERAEETELEAKVLSLFVQMDADKNNRVAGEELAAVIDENPALRRRLLRNLDLDVADEGPGASGADSSVVAAAIVKAVSAASPEMNDWSGDSHSIGWYDLERAVKGTAPVDYRKAPESPKLCRENMLRGARARAEITRTEGGGYAGLTDAKEAVIIGERARDLQVNRRALYVESEPDVWHDGALYGTDAAARRARDAKQREIEETLRAEGLIRDEFPGLDAAAAAAVRSEIKTGGVVVDIEDDDDMAKKKTRKLPPKLETLRNTPIKSRAIVA